MKAQKSQTKNVGFKYATMAAAKYSPDQSIDTDQSQNENTEASSSQTPS